MDNYLSKYKIEDLNIDEMERDFASWLSQEVEQEDNQDLKIFGLTRLYQQMIKLAVTTPASKLKLQIPLFFNIEYPAPKIELSEKYTREEPETALTLHEVVSAIGLMFGISSVPAIKPISKLYRA